MITPEYKFLANDNEMAIICSFNFPAILSVFGMEKWDQLRGLFNQLIGMKKFRVKKPLACSLHEIAQITG